MVLEDLLKMRGEWVGTGEMTVGDNQGPIQEYLKLEETDIEGCLSYIRKSRIDFPGRPTLHNECGYMRLPTWAYCYPVGVSRSWPGTTLRRGTSRRRARLIPGKWCDS